MSELRVLVAKGTEAESRSTINGQATSTSTIRAARDFAVVLTLAVNGDRLSRRVAREVRSSYARPGLQQTGLAPSAAAAQGAVTTTTRCAGNKITYKYHPRYGANSLVGGKGSVAPPSAGRLPRKDAKHGAVNAPPSRPELIAVPRRFAPRGSRGMASVEAQIMAGCPVIYYDDGGPPVLRLLRWSAEALALWLSGICGRRDPDTSVCRRCDGPSNVWFGGRANPHVSRAPYFPTP